MIMQSACNKSRTTRSETTEQFGAAAHAVWREKTPFSQRITLHKFGSLAVCRSLQELDCFP